MKNQESIKDTLNTIRKALEEDNFIDDNNKEKNILLLNQLVNDDGKIEIIDEYKDNSNYVKDILDQKITEIFNQHFDKWLDKNLPRYLDKYNKKNSN